MPTSKVSRGEGARYGGLDGSAGNLPPQLRVLSLGYLFSHITAMAQTEKNSVEHIFSASPSAPDIARHSRRFAFGPTADTALAFSVIRRSPLPSFGAKSRPQPASARTLNYQVGQC